MSAGRGPADPSAKNIWCDAKDHARPRKYLEQNIFSKRGVQVEPQWARDDDSDERMMTRRQDRDGQVGGHSLFLIIAAVQRRGGKRAAPVSRWRSVPHRGRRTAP